jgi:hypothetical protein
LVLFFKKDQPYLQGGAVPSLQTIFAPGGSTTVPAAGGEDPPPTLELHEASASTTPTPTNILANNADNLASATGTSFRQRL